MATKGAPSIWKRADATPAAESGATTSPPSSPALRKEAPPAAARKDDSIWAPKDGRVVKASMPSDTKTEWTKGSLQQDAVMAPRQATAMDHLKEAARVTSDTEKLGVDTLGELERQREQLERVQRKLDETEVHADDSKRILKGMGSIFSRIAGVFSSKPALPKDILEKREAERTAQKDVVDAEVAAKRAARQADAKPELYKTSDPRYKDEDELLDVISSNVHGIKKVAEAMKDELERQDVLIDNVAESTDRVNAKVSTSAKTARRIARS